MSTLGSIWRRRSRGPRRGQRSPNRLRARVGRSATDTPRPSLWSWSPCASGGCVRADPVVDDLGTAREMSAGFSSNRWLTALLSDVSGMRSAQAGKLSRALRERRALAAEHALHFFGRARRISFEPVWPSHWALVHGPRPDGAALDTLDSLSGDGPSPVRALSPCPPARDAQPLARPWDLAVSTFERLREVSQRADLDFVSGRARCVAGEYELAVPTCGGVAKLSSD